MQKRNPKKGGRGTTPVSFKGNNMPASQMHQFMEEWSLTQAESNHVETIDEANDFDIFDDDDDFFEKTPNLTVYEMHDQAEENLALYNDSLPEEEDETEQEKEAESNETDDRAQDKNQPLPDQSAPVTTDSPPSTS